MKCSYCQRVIVRNLTVWEILYPAAIKSGRCSQCNHLFEKIQPPYCPTCKKQGVTQQCHECQRWHRLYPDYDFGHDALFQYNEGFQQWIFQYKFQGDYQLRSTFQEEIKQYFKSKQALICPIPLSSERYQARGFNQVAAFLEASQIPITPLLSKGVDTTPQSERTRKERLEMLQPFQVEGELERIKNQEIILVDDVYTTGRTLFHAAELLLSYQPKSIRSFSLAR
jgi:Predicted amidophosphoribosyltransferases